MINYDLPNSRELYIHRIGRSGRFGRKVGTGGLLWKVGSVERSAQPLLRPLQPRDRTGRGSSASMWCFGWKAGDLPAGCCASGCSAR